LIEYDIDKMQAWREPSCEQLASQLKLLTSAFEILKRRLLVLESEVQVRLESGQYVPGYTLEFSDGNRYWNISLDRAMRIGVPKKVSSLMTPRQAEINGFPKELIDRYTEIKTSVKLTEVDIDQINDRLKNG